MGNIHRTDPESLLAQYTDCSFWYAASPYSLQSTVYVSEWKRLHIGAKQIHIPRMQQDVCVKLHAILNTAMHSIGVKIGNVNLVNDLERDRVLHWI